MIDYETALHELNRHARHPDVCHMDLSQCLGSISAESIMAPCPLPRFRNSAMDGFSVRSKDFSTLLSGEIKELRCIGTTMAGSETLQQGDFENTCMEIMTGAIVADGYDSVIPVEQAVRHNGQIISFNTKPEPMDNVRQIGEDYKENELIVPMNSRITPQALMALCAFNFQKIPVYKAMRTAIIATGAELIRANQTSLVQIYDSNSPYLKAALASMPLSVADEVTTIHDDDESHFCNRLIQLMQNSDLIISTGAVSAGQKDFIPTALEKIGAKIIFHKVAIRPGKPLLFALLPNGGFYFGLPGNPVSSAVGLAFFIKPFIDACYGLKNDVPILARLIHDYTIKKPLTFFLKAKVICNDEGQLLVELLTGQESFKISSLVKSNCFAKLCHHKTNLHEGDLIPVFPFQRLHLQG